MKLPFDTRKSELSRVKRELKRDFKREKQAVKVAAYAINLAERGVVEKQVAAATGRFSLSRLIQVTLGGQSFEPVVAEKANVLLEPVGLSITAKTSGGVDIGHDQHMTVHVMPDQPGQAIAA